MHAGDRLAGWVGLAAVLLLVTALVAGCIGRAGRGDARRATNTELVLIARGSLHGLLVPTG